MTGNKGIGVVVENPFVKNGSFLLSKISATDDLKKNIREAVKLIGGFGKVIQKGDEILLKPNFNTSDAPPGSSDPAFVKGVIELLYEQGAARIVIGESSMLSASARSIFEQTGMLRLAEEAGAEAIFFDEGSWEKATTGGKYLRTVSLPSGALGEKKVVYVCCMKTHRWAKFTLSLKLAVGFMKPNERMSLHARRLEEKIADLNLVVHPSLLIMDGRKCFINGGPACGELRTPNVVMASGDRVALDVEAVKIIQSFEGTSLLGDPWSYTQIRRAAELGIGVKSEGDYQVVHG